MLGRLIKMKIQPGTYRSTLFGGIQFKESRRHFTFIRRRLRSFACTHSQVIIKNSVCAIPESFPEQLRRLQDVPCLRPRNRQRLSYCFLLHPGSCLFFSRHNEICKLLIQTRATSKELVVNRRFFSRSLPHHPLSSSSSSSRRAPQLGFIDARTSFLLSLFMNKSRKKERKKEKQILTCDIAHGNAIFRVCQRIHIYYIHSFRLHPFSRWKACSPLVDFIYVYIFGPRVLPRVPCPGC